ncbi:MAG: hypothetical protein V4616_09165, partial [Bacteroidota bacterium]
MKKLIILSAITLSVLTLSAQNKGEVRGQQFGKSIKNENIMDVPALVQEMKNTDEISTVRVRGTVTDVCQKKGC